MKRIDRTGWQYRRQGDGIITIIGYCPNMRRWVGSCATWCMVIGEIEYSEMREWERVK